MTEQLKFNKKKHLYTIGKGKNKIEFTSVTQFVHKFFEPFDEKQASQLSYYKRRKTEPGITPAKIRKEWKTVRELGTQIHREIDQLIKGERDLTHDNHPFAVDAATRHAMLIGREQVVETETEKMVFSKDLKLAGTIDLFLQNTEGEAVLVDWKTNKEIRFEGYKGRKGIGPCSEMDDCNFSHYTLQLSVYAYILEREYGYKIKKLYLCHLTPDGSVLHPVSYEKQTVENMLKEMMVNGN